VLHKFYFRFGVALPLFNALFLVIFENITINHILPKIDSLGYIVVADNILT